MNDVDGDDVDPNLPVVAASGHAALAAHNDSIALGTSAHIEVPAVTQVVRTIAERLSNLLANILGNDEDTIPRIYGRTFNGVNCKLVETKVDGINVIKCMLEVNTVPTNQSTRHIGTNSQAAFHIPLPQNENIILITKSC
jgi:hypothetical protein